MSNSFNKQRLQVLLKQKTLLEAEIASIQPSNVQQHQSSSSHGRQSVHRQSRRQDVPRSYSHSGSSISRTLSTGQGQYESIPISGSISQHSAPPMARYGSKGSTSSVSSTPFTNPTGHMPPPLHERRHTSVIDSYMNHQDDPVNDYTFGRSQRQPLEQLTEIDNLEHPESYLARMAPVVSVTPSPVESHPHEQWRNPNMHRLSVSSQRSQSFGIQSPTTPSTATLTTCTTASEMSRENSYCSDVINGPFKMMTVNSNNSLSFDNDCFNDRSYQAVNLPSQSKRFSSDEQSLLVTGVGASHSSYALFSSPESADQTMSSSLSGNMKRSQSNESSSSTSSMKSRSTAQLQRQNQIASTRPIAPKAENDEFLSKKGSSSGSGLKSKSGSDDRMQISKAPYQRPKHERVFCVQCTDFSEGFRGAHELGRHIDRQHKVVVKKWVCVEPSDNVNQREFRPVIPLSKCKACANQKKKYGAYYNAAAHLRRAHFKPKPRGRSKSTKVENALEKRGGKGGGDWPPMGELKRWMKEISVRVSENDHAQADDEDCEDDHSVSGFDDENIIYNSTSNLAAVTSSYQGGFAYNPNIDSLMIDPYPQLPTTDNFETQCMPSMQFLQQSIDISMAYHSGQASFDSQPQLMSDSMNNMGSFMNDSFSQGYDLSPTDILSFQTFNPIM